MIHIAEGGWEAEKEEALWLYTQINFNIEADLNYQKVFISGQLAEWKLVSSVKCKQRWAGVSNAGWRLSWFMGNHLGGLCSALATEGCSSASISTSVLWFLLTGHVCHLVCVWGCETGRRSWLFSEGCHTTPSSHRSLCSEVCCRDRSQRCCSGSTKSTTAGKELLGRFSEYFVMTSTDHLWRFSKIQKHCGEQTWGRTLSVWIYYNI